MMNQPKYDPALFSQWMNWRARYASNGNARETAYQILRDKIIFLELKPGEPLNDKQLAEELEMSRTPVREALIILSTVNMVILRPQVGTFVAPIDAEWVEMEQFARRATEKEIIRQACAVPLGEEIRLRYEENIRRYEAYAAGDDPERVRRLLELDNEFHRIAFSAMSRENNFFHMLNDMQHIERLRAISLIDKTQTELNRDHSAISRAVLAGDEKEALAHLDRHLSLYRDSLAKAREKYPEYFTFG